MKANFKPLGLAAAVAAVTAGYAGVTQAQADLANNSLGDVAVIPYYTVVGDFVTGVHIINTDAVNTQVVKLRLRRGSDSMDAMDFNIVLSPNDEWTGFIDDNNAEGIVFMSTEDNSCTAPEIPDGRFEMPGLYAEGATEGYIEVIGMAQAAPNTPIAVAALHKADGVPADCFSVESNFFRNATAANPPPGTVTAKGITSSGTSNQTCTEAVGLALGLIPFGQTCASQSLAVLPNTYAETGNVLKVSFFHRDATSGLEFGNSAVHMEDFSAVPMMSNQEIIVVGASDPWGYLFPDLDGGSPGDTGRGLFEDVRVALGADSIINDWSVASARNVSTDWVVTLPGQYLMLDLQKYTLSLFDDAINCWTVEQANALPAPAVPAQNYCDERDLPVVLGISVYDREEQTFTNPDSGLVISPAVTNQPGTDSLEYEVNVISWTDGTNLPVLPSEYQKEYDIGALGGTAGWAALGVKSATNKTQGIYNFALSTEELPAFDSLTELSVPIVGFVAWERSFPSDPSANYGRIVEHSYGYSSSS